MKTLADHVIELEKVIEQLKAEIKELKIKNEVLSNQIYYP